MIILIMMIMIMIMMIIKDQYVCLECVDIVRVRRKWH
ncbi:hypothetical protein M0802_015365, partial [Mischocyttarus mexicanus]